MRWLLMCGLQAALLCSCSGAGACSSPAVTAQHGMLR